MSTLIKSEAVLQRAPSTISLYNRLYSQFEKKIRRLEGLHKDSEINPAQVALHFNENEGGWESKTARLYRASLMYVFREKLSTGDVQSNGAIELLTHVHVAEEDRLARFDDLRRQRKELRKLPPRGPRQKVKRFSRQDTEIMVKSLISMRSVHGPAAAMWFIATTMTGLRPCEWVNAHMETHHTVQHALVVRNAKATNGRAHGETRTIVLSNITEKQEKLLRSHMDNVRNSCAMEKFDAFYRNCRRCIERTADTIWPNRDKHPSLYTARHMFAADAKSVYDKFKVAALMGHASIETAGDHYARKWSGSGSISVEPDESDVLAVVELNKPAINENSWVLETINAHKEFKSSSGSAKK